MAMTMRMAMRMAMAPAPTWTGVNATLLAKPLTACRARLSLPLMLEAPPHTAACFCMFFFSVWLIRTCTNKCK